MTDPMRRAALTLVVLISALLGACVDSSSSTTASTEQALALRCGSDCDCPYGTVCGGGTCQPDFGPFPPCYCAARDCAPGQSCTDGFCTTGAPTCQSDCDCGFGAFCTDGACQPDFGPFAECYCAARDCGPGQTCTGGFCTTQPQTCRSHCDCGFGAVCADGACQPDFGPFAECYCSARDCGAGQICAAGVCRDRGRPR